MQIWAFSCPKHSSGEPSAATILLVYSSKLSKLLDGNISFDTKDIVEEHDGYIKITGRTGDVINVGGLKFMASEVERIALMHPNVGLVKAYAKNNSNLFK